MNPVVLGLSMAILMIRSSNDMEELRELARIFALKYIYLSRSIEDAMSQMLSGAEPEEVATIQRTFDAVTVAEREYAEKMLDEMGVDKGDLPW